MGAKPHPATIIGPAGPAIGRRWSGNLQCTRLTESKEEPEMPSRPASARRTRGFTLIELIVTVAIVAILAAIALPSFARVIASNRVASGVNELIAAVNLARTEAIRRNRPAGVCASENGTACSTDWDKGYLVYYMSDATPSVLVAVRTGKFSPKDTVTGEDSLSDIRFTRRGMMADSDEAGAVLYKPADEKYEDLQRCLKISLSGSASIVPGPCQEPASPEPSEP